MFIADGSEVNTVLNKYNLWRLVTSQTTDENGQSVFVFEAWTDTQEEKDGMWSELKPFVDQYGETINWHECTHDEPNTQPCVIQESYSK